MGPLAGWRGEDGKPNPDQLQKYIDNGCFWHERIAPEASYFKQANRAYLDYAKAKGWIAEATPITLNLYDETLQKFRLAAEGHGDHQPPDNLRHRVKTYCDPLPFWYPPFEETSVEGAAFPLSAITQRPMQMYHSWGSQNAWLRQINAKNALYIHRDLAKAHDLEDGDWVWVTSHHGRIKVPVKTMTGVNRHTVWTWNAIGKRKRAWGLADNAPEAKEGFLLNHVISDLLPERKDGYRYANADPITGQAAWYDLRVRIEKCDPAEVSEPQFPPVKPKRNRRVPILKFGAKS